MPEKLYPEIALQEQQRRERRGDDADVNKFKAGWTKRGPDVPASREEKRQRDDKD